MLEEQLQNILNFLHTNPIVAVAIGGVVIVLFYSKPKEMFKLVGFCLFIVVVFYLLSFFAGTLTTGSKHKDQMIYKSKKVIEE